MKTILLLVVIINLISFLSRRGGRFVSILSLVLLAYVIFNAQAYSDIANYKRYFEDAFYTTTRTREIGFFYLTKLIQCFTIDFDIYRTVLFCIGFSILCCAAFSYGSNISLFLIAYTTYFFFMDGIQIRNFLALSILAYSVKWILKPNEASAINYVIGIVLATSIHSSFFLYLVLLLAKYDYKIIISGMRMKTVIVTLTFIFSGIFFLVTRYSTIINDLVFSLGALFPSISERTGAYSSTSSQLGWAAPTLTYLLGLLLIAFAFKASFNTSEGITSRMLRIEHHRIFISRALGFNKIILERIFMITILGLIFIPLCAINLTFYRFGKNILFIDFMLLPQIYTYLSFSNRHKAIAFLAGFAIVIVGLCLFDFTIYNDWSMFEDIYFSI